MTRNDESEGVVWQDLTDKKVYMTWFGLDYCSSSTTQATPSSNTDHLIAAASDGSNIIIFQLGDGGESKTSGTSFTSYKVDATTGAQTLTKVYDTSKNGVNTYAFHASGASIVWNTDADQVFMVLARTMTRASDGLNHQGELALIFDASTLNLVKNWGQTASHSFANSAFLASDGSYLSLALGDNYPRGIMLSKFTSTTSKQSKLVYAFKTKHGTTATSPAGQTYAEYTSISGGGTTYYKWSNDNNVYTELAHRGVVEVSDGLLVFFSGENPALDNSEVGSVCNKDRNLGFVKWSKDVSSSTPLSSGASETGGFYAFGGSWTNQENKGINFLTSYSSADCATSVSRPKTAPTGSNVFLLWEMWTKSSYVKTQAMVVNKDGTVIQQAFDLSYNLRLPFTDDLITRYDSTQDITKIIAYTGEGGKLVRYEICSGASCSSKSQSGATCGAGAASTSGPAAGSGATTTVATTIVATTTPPLMEVVGTLNLLVASASSFMNDEVAKDGVKAGIAVAAGALKDWITLSFSNSSRRLESRDDLSEDGRRLADALEVSYEILVPSSANVTASVVQSNLASKQVSELQTIIKENVEVAKGGSYNITVTAKGSVTTQISQSGQQASTTGDSFLDMSTRGLPWLSCWFIAVSAYFAF
jgi:hypothetical protein